MELGQGSRERGGRCPKQRPRPRRAIVPAPTPASAAPRGIQGESGPLERSQTAAGAFDAPARLTMRGLRAVHAPGGGAGSAPAAAFAALLVDPL